MARPISEQIIALHAALCEKQGQTITISWLAKQTGYTESALRTYLSKNMLAPHVVKASQNTCQIISSFTLSQAELRRCLSQRRNRYTWEHLGVTELVSDLLDRSKTNAGLALELINRPEMANRMDAFVLLFMTAWEQLLKADLEHRKPGAIFTGRKNSAGRRLTLGLTGVINEIFPCPKDAVRRNIEVIKNLRDDAAHLLVSDVVGIASRYFQSSVLNYIRHFQDFTMEPPFRFEGTGLLVLGVAYESPQIELLRARYGQTATEIKALIERLEQQAMEVEDKDFAVSIEYKLVLGNKPGADAIKLTTSEDGKPAIVVSVPKDPKVTHPYNATQVAERLNVRVGDGRWGANHVAAVAELLKVKNSDNKYHYAHKSGKSISHTYSEKFVDRIYERWKSDPKLISKAYNARRKRSR